MNPAITPTTSNTMMFQSVVLLVAAVLTGGGVAVASWLATGTGPANAQAVSVQSLLISAGSPTATLYPMPSGGYSSASTGTVSATVSNPNPFPVTITSVTLGAVSIAPLAGRTCSAGSVVTSSATPITLSPAVAVPANSSGVPLTVPSALQMTSTADDGCQGATFGVALSVSGASA